ncbi:MAG: TetR family transcriptional regulator [Actinomycetes bacterium]
MSTARSSAAESLTDGRLTVNQAARRRRVIEAAAELAGEGGYEAVQMRDVAARADVALGTIYRYFESKDQLLAATLVDWAARLRRRLDAKPPVGATPTERVVDVVRRASRSIERNQRLSSALVTAMASHDEGVHTYQAEVSDILVSLLDGALDGVDAEHRAGVLRILSQVWFAALIGWVNGWR